MSEGRTRPKTIVFAAILTFALVAGAWMFQRGAISDRVNGTRLFAQVSAAVRDNFVDTVSEARVYQLAVDGMLSELDDPYDAYLTPDRANRLSERTSGSYAGIGLQVDVRDGSLVVVSPLPGGPAIGLEFLLAIALRRLTARRLPGGLLRRYRSSCVVCQDLP